LLIRGLQWGETKKPGGFGLLCCDIGARTSANKKNAENWREICGVGKPFDKKKTELKGEALGKKSSGRKRGGVSRSIGGENVTKLEGKDRMNLPGESGDEVQTGRGGGG